MSSEPLQHVTDFVDTVLHWTPDILLADNAYDGDVHALPHLPQTQSVSEYKSAYKPAVRAEVYTQLSEALQRPDKLVRPIQATQVISFTERHKMELLGSRSILLEFQFNTSPKLRSKDFVFIFALANTMGGDGRDLCARSCTLGSHSEAVGLRIL